jgi:hypothetical protein
VHFLREQSE